MSAFKVGDFVMPISTAHLYSMALPITAIDSRGIHNGYMFHPESDIRAATNEEIEKYRIEAAAFAIGDFVVVLKKDKAGAFPIAGYEARGFCVDFGRGFVESRFRSFELRRATPQEVKAYFKRRETDLRREKRNLKELLSDLEKEALELATLREKAIASGQLG
jgi:hypothetical protein